jgi:hypothetical protein
MKFRYAITYAKLSPDVSGTEAVKKAFGDHVKEAERHGLKVPFWGSPWGTSEDIVIVYEFDDISKYEKYMEADRKNPFTGGRTNIVIEW